MPGFRTAHGPQRGLPVPHQGHSRDVAGVKPERQQRKVQEPTKHQYDWDVATTMGFLNQYGLSDEFKLNVECNHATLAGHSCDHELQVRTLHPASGTPCRPQHQRAGWEYVQVRMLGVQCLSGGMLPASTPHLSVVGSEGLPHSEGQ